MLKKVTKYALKKIFGSRKMSVFKSILRNDEAFINGIGRFNVELNGDEGDVKWSQSKSDN